MGEGAGWGRGAITYTDCVCVFLLLDSYFPFSFSICLSCGLYFLVLLSIVLVRIS